MRLQSKNSRKAKKQNSRKAEYRGRFRRAFKGAMRSSVAYADFRAVELAVASVERHLPI